MTKNSSSLEEWMSPRYKWIIFGNRLENEYALWFEPQHDKTNKMSVCPARLRSAWASAPSDKSLRCALNG